MTVRVCFQHTNVLSNSFQRLPALTELVLCTCTSILHRLHNENWNPETNWQKRPAIFTLKLLQSTQKQQNSFCHFSTSLVLLFISVLFWCTNIIGSIFHSKSIRFQAIYTYNIWFFNQFVASSTFECIHMAPEYTKEHYYEGFIGNKPALLILITEFSFHHIKKDHNQVSLT